MNNLRELRKENDLNQEQMAAELGVSLSMYQKVEQGNAKAGRKFMEKIKQRFPEASIDYIFFATNSGISAVASAQRRPNT